MAVADQAEPALEGLRSQWLQRMKRIGVPGLDQRTHLSDRSKASNNKAQGSTALNLGDTNCMTGVLDMTGLDQRTKLSVEKSG